MPQHVLIAPDKFKGTLTARAAAEAIRRGWSAVRPDDQFELLPMSDGGDGFGEIISGILGAEIRTMPTVDASHRPCEASWWWEPKSRTAIMEAARINGLAQLPPGQYHPFDLDTSGLGAVLRAAAALGAQRCLMGIGGSATNDGGFGVARDCGTRFLDAQGHELTRWTDLAALALIMRPPRHPFFADFVVAVDVQNPLLGPQGCSRVYGPQKGLRPEDFPKADECLGRLADVMRNQFGMNSADEPGAGAAGGLGFGLRSFLGARLSPGFQIFSDYAGLPERLRSVQLVITGEGALDAQTLMGKGVGELALACKKHGVPCIGLAGVVPDPAKARELFSMTCAMTPDLTAPDKARADAAFWLEQAAMKAAREAVSRHH